MGIGWISVIQPAGALNGGGAVAEPTAPAQFGTGDWSVADDVTGGDITITITALPDDGGSAITDLEYQLDGGSWVSLSGTSTGDYPVSGLTDDQEYDVAIRAVNAIGNGTASATKAVTPTEPFSPLDLTPTAWYDPSDLTTLFQDAARTTPVTTDGDVVGSMMDKSGNGLHLTQGTTANKPLYKTSGGLHWLLYDGVNDGLNVATTLAQPFTLIAGNALTDGGAALTSIVASGTLFGGNNAADYRIFCGTSVTYVTTRDANNHVLVGIANGASSSLRLDAVEVAAGNAGAGGITSPLNVGSTAAQMMNGRLHGLVIVGSVVSGANLSDVETWMGTQAGLSI